MLPAKALVDYADGLALPNPNNSQLLAELDVLRQLIEAVYQQRITFKVEKRQPSGPVVEGEINLERILGNAAGVEAGSITQGRVKGTVKANELGPNAHAAGVKVDRIG